MRIDTVPSSLGYERWKRDEVWNWREKRTKGRVTTGAMQDQDQDQVVSNGASRGKTLGSSWRRNKSQESRNRPKLGGGVHHPLSRVNGRVRQGGPPRPIPQSGSQGMALLACLVAEQQRGDSST